MPHLQYYIVAAILLGFGIAEFAYECYEKRTKNDWTLEIASFFNVMLLIHPAIILMTGKIMTQLVPSLQGMLTSLSWWQGFLILIVLDDMVQYWYHRAAHHFPLFWKWHRTHHSAPEMGVGVVERNGALYYLIMPSFWIGGVLIYLGLGATFVIYAIIKMLIIVAAHSPLKWDKFLYETPWLRPLGWLVVRTISTPTTHFAHHGRSAQDGISNPDGNFGNMLFLWDLIFGTGKITLKYPNEFGVPDERGEKWYVQLWYPLFKSKDPNSTLK